MMALLLSVVAIMPVMAAVTAGTITTNKDYVSPTGSVKVTVTDADLNVSTSSTSLHEATFNSGTILFFSLPDTNNKAGTGTFAQGTSAGDEVAGTLTLTKAAIDGTDKALADYVPSIVAGASGKVSVQYVGADNPGFTSLTFSYKIASKNTTTVKVTSPSDPSTGISVALTETGADTNKYEGTFTVQPTASSDALDLLQAVAGQTVTIKYTDASHDNAKRTKTVSVESTKPAGTLNSPANKTFTSDLTPTLSVDFTDTDSTVDKGTILFVVDAIVGTGSLPYAAGATIAADTEAITSGFKATKTLTAFTDGKTSKLTWYAQATDKAGNVGRTDADSSKTGDQSYILNVDKEGPSITGATAYVGYWWDVANATMVVDTKKASITSIAVEFPDFNSQDEVLDGTTLSGSDFEIDGLKNAAGSSVNDVTPTAVNVYDDLKNTAFLTVADMAPDAKPSTIKLKTAISDSAGNGTSTGSVGTVHNKIAPTLTATLDKTLDKDKVKVTITSNEALLGAAPTVKINDGDASALSSVTGTLVDTLTWTASLDPSAGGVWAVEVSATDVDNNAATLGNGLDTALFPTSKSIKFETDTALPASTLIPANAASPETADPFFLTIDHSDEAKEYGLDAAGAMTTTIASVSTDLDTSATVTLTKVTLVSPGSTDKVDILSTFETQDNLKFTAPVTGIANGEHKLAYTAEDASGNKYSGSTTFTVKARKAYKVAMNAGWNLISFPGAPVDGAIGSVLDADHPATSVLSFNDGAWSVADKTGGVWEGDLKTLDDKHGYWINSPSAQAVSALLALPAVGSASTLPTISVEKGWNLVSVIDLAQTKQGSSGDTRTGAAYFTSVSWSVAYSYNSSTRAWTRVTSSAGDVLNGQGVWVWATKAGTLIP
jgi:hypothetical protein